MNTKIDADLTGEIIFKKYKTLQKIGKGAFGQVYRVQNIITKEIFAMKTELISSEQKNLETEAYYLISLKGFGIPKFITYGHIKTHYILIEELLGESLNDIFERQNRECPISDICMIGMQLLDRLEWIHSKNILYRDIKPDNILIGKKDKNVIYLIDFGLCKKYRASKTGKHILPKKTGFFSGNMKYASFNALIGKEQSRRDDLISLGYLLIFLAKKQLPWNYDVNYFDKAKYSNLLYNKKTNGNGSLYNGIPNEFKKFMEYNNNLKFEQKPNYEYLKSLLNNILSRMKLDIRNICFSWVNSNDKKLIGYPRNNTIKKISPKRRILKLLKENSLKKIREGKSQENTLITDKSISIPKNHSNIKRKNHKRNVIQIKTNKLELNDLKNHYNDSNNQNDISQINHILNTEIEKNQIKTINDIKNISKLPKPKLKIIKVNKNKLAQLDLDNNTIILNNDIKKHPIYFNKKNMTKENTKKKKININKVQISPLKKLSFSNNRIANIPQNNTISYNSEKNIFKNKLNKKRNVIQYINIPKDLNNNTTNADSFNKVNKSNLNSKNNSSKKIYDMSNNKLNNDYFENSNYFSNNTNLIYNQTSPNIGVMIINNYNNIRENKYKKILINKNNNDSDLYKNGSFIRKNKIKKFNIFDDNVNNFF